MLGLVERLGKSVGKRLEGASTAAWKWRGRSVKIVDGATVTMPDTEDNQAQYSQHGKQKSGLKLLTLDMAMLKCTHD